MATKAKCKDDAKKAGNSNSLTVNEKDGKSRDRLMAEVGLSAIVANTNTARAFGKGSFGELDLTESVAVMREKAAKVRGGDMSEVEDILTAQAITLDAMFNELARRAALNMGEHLSATETYLRLAFKAQAQSRSTLETLAEVKYPKAATFVKQQNVAYQQQVNNDDKRTSTHAPAHGKILNPSNELLEAHHGERLDTRTTGTTSGNDLQLATLETIDRPENKQRQTAQ